MSDTTRKLTVGITRQELVLIFITVIWGERFWSCIRRCIIQVRSSLSVYALLPLRCYWRFFPPLSCCCLLARSQSGHDDRPHDCGGYGLQTWGMQTISSSQSAFLTALYVPVVPLLQWLFLRRPPKLMAWLGISLAFCGLILVAGPQDGRIALNQGEAATLLSTLAIAGEIILISRFAGQVDVRRVTFIQLAVASLCAFCFMIPNGESVPALSTPLLVSAVGLGAASALIQVTMNWAQRSVSPTRATVIYAGEPVWAGVVGRLAGERLPAAAILGGILIVCGVIVSELRWKRSMPSASSDE